MKQISLFIPLLGTLLLSGCAGTSTEFECNATTSDIRTADSAIRSGAV
ncbi:type IV conjugative transfer system protein TraV [Escherichia coli]|nr:type IV conjugative transfer system protein TraV [Escherichia coli]